MAGVLKKTQLQVHVQRIVAKRPETRVIGFSVATPWEGGGALPVGDRVFRVCECPSDLAIREVLAEAEAERGDVVVLTPVDTRELEEDLAARMFKGRLLETDAWATVQELFQAVQVDPRLRKCRWLADGLLDSVAETDFRPAPAGVLSADLAWGTMLVHGLGMPCERPDAQDIMRWAHTPGRVSAYQRLDDMARGAICEWIQAIAGPLGSMLLRTTDRGHAERLWALGLACEVIFSPDGNRRLRDAAVRLERFTGEPVSGELGRAWAESALALFRTHADDRERAELGKATDALLEHLGAAGETALSTVSPGGLEALFGAFGACLASRSKESASDRTAAAKALLQRLEGHALASGAGHRIARAAMAVRLARWLARPPAAPHAGVGLAGLAGMYAAEGSFVDWARNALRHGDACREVEAAYSALCAAAETHQEAFANAFAHRLVDWSATGSTCRGVIPVERLLRDVVAPLAAAGPVLLMVMDGMGLAIFWELLEDLLIRRRWNRFRPEDADQPALALAALPSITEVSRRSMLCGRLTDGQDANERQEFAANPDLIKTGGKSRPRLFLKGQTDAAGGLETDLRTAIADTGIRTVGVVVNAVDDYLLKSDQLDVCWRVALVPLLEKVLEAAAVAGRTVILTSDHGHVLERHSRYREHPGGERYRRADGTLDEGEIAIRGARVMAPEAGIMVGAWREDLRYGKYRKNGYHGGVSPQEVLVPLAVLSQESELPGWRGCALDYPSWWHDTAGTPAVAPPSPASGRSTQGLPLFAAATPEDWVAAMFASEIYASQKNMLRRGRLSDDRIEALCRALDASGGSLPRAALAATLDMPPTRIAGFVSSAQRLLNVEGYPVLEYDADTDTVRMDSELLQQQFGL